MKTCKDCDYYVMLGEGKNGKGVATEVGTCFRYPPTVLSTDGSAYPVVGSASRECGEFKPKRRGK